MNWLKRKLNKWFFNDDIDEQNEYDEEIEEWQNTTYETELKQRPKFRFPLIEDDELRKTNQDISNHDIKTYNAMYTHNQSKQELDQVYDVEVSRIHELLEARRQKKNVTNKNYDISKRYNEILVEREKKKEPPKKEQQRKTEKIDPPTNRKRFIPTAVPSPVYGFQKPKGINTLLSEQQEKKENVVNEVEFKSTSNAVLQEKRSLTSTAGDSEKELNESQGNETSIDVSKEIINASQEVATPSIIEEIDKKLEQVKEEVEQIIHQPIKNLSIALEEVEERPVVCDEVVQNESSPSLAIEGIENLDEHEFIFEQRNSVEEQEVLPETITFDENIANDYEEELVDVVEEELIEETDSHIKIHEEELQEEMEEIPVQIEVQDQEDDESSIVDEENEAQNVITKKDKLIPFNVIMLKSDKEKLAQKMKALEELKNVQKKEQQLGQQVVQPQQTIEEISPEDVKKEEEPIQEIRLQYKYVKPPLDCLTPPEESMEDRDWMESQAEVLVEALSHFQVTANVESIMQGPAVTQFEITVAHGTKVSKIRNLADDLKLALAAKDIRIQAPIPGKNTIGIEIPNRISRAVRLSEVVNSDSFLQSDSPLEAALGLDLTGKPVTIDLRKMPHGLIAGATGSGKSVCINSILVSLLLKAEPTELKLMLIDPKMVELAPFNHIPHLVSPVITDVKAANAALKWAVDEMERRYQLFAHAGVRDLPRYNKLVTNEGKERLKLPYILIVIDELADLMMMAPQDVEESICRIAQKARACGIHLIIATQRPSVDVITGLIKSNIPTRIAFAVSSQIDSRTILDSQGAERLLGRGDMLYLGNGMTDPIRLQGTYVTDDEIELIIDHVKEQGEPDYFFEQDELLRKAEMVEEQDELFEDVCRFVYEQGTASTSSIQRKYHIGYNRAARLIEMLESYGFVSEQKGSKPRDVFITESDLAEMFDR